MSTLVHPSGRQITVPDRAVASYIAGGWAAAGAPAPESPPKKRRAPRKSTAKQEATNVPVRPDSDTGAP
jgi:hypothetical protein